MLSRLSPRDYARISPQLEQVPLRFGQTIYKAKAEIDYVYFPEAGVLSIVGITGGHKPIEVGIVGSEGLAGLPLFLGVRRSANMVNVQAGGMASRLKAAHALSEFTRGGSFRDAVLLFAHELFLQVSHTTSCNRHHEVEERLSRWLLMIRDRVTDDTLELTQEFLSWMLGVRNQAVSRAAMTVQEAGAIKYSRGAVTILDRTKLEQRACACYRMMKSHTNGHRRSSILKECRPTTAINGCVQTKRG